MSQIQFMGVLLVVCGGVYFAKPNIFRRGPWMRTSIAIRKLSPETYVKYMRGLGIVFIVIGVVFVVCGLPHGSP